MKDKKDSNKDKKDKDEAKDRLDHKDVDKEQNKEKDKP